MPQRHEGTKPHQVSSYNGLLLCAPSCLRAFVAFSAPCQILNPVPDPIIDYRERFAWEDMSHRKADILHRTRAPRQRILEAPRPFCRVELIVLTGDNQNICVAVLILVFVPVTRDSTAHRDYAPHDSGMTEREAVVQRHRLRE